MNIIGIFLAANTNLITALMRLSESQFFAVCVTDIVSYDWLV